MPDFGVRDPGWNSIEDVCVYHNSHCDIHLAWTAHPAGVPRLTQLCTLAWMVI